MDKTRFDVYLLVIYIYKMFSDLILEPVTTAQSFNHVHISTRHVHIFPCFASHGKREEMS